MANLACVDGRINVGVLYTSQFEVPPATILGYFE